eukprot:jgi/Tetstr1/447002/TSEL_034460.t1
MAAAAPPACSELHTSTTSSGRYTRSTAPALFKQLFCCALTARAICTGPLANLELPTVEQLAETIATTISKRTNTPPELQHAQWLTDTMTAAGVEMYLHHSEPTLLRVGDDNLCAISLGKEDKDQTIREAGELGDTTGHNQIRRATIGMRKKARKTAPAALALRATGRPIYTLTLQLTAHHHNIIGGTRSTDRTDQWRKTVSTAHSPVATAIPEAWADDEEELELNYEKNEQRHGDKGKAATTAKIKKQQPMGRSRSDGAPRNRSRNKPPLSGTRSSDSEWMTCDDAAHPSNISHQ